jgi:Phage integrase, N-terminal SAM-like domain
MTTTTPEAAPGVLVPVADPLFSVAEQQALAGFLSGYSGLTRDAYTLDLRQYTAWCTLHGLHLFAAKRVDIESFRCQMEAAGRARATIARRLCTIAGFYRYAVEEELLDHSPAAHVRRPRLDYESHATALDRNELGALLVAGGFGTAQEHALISLLALNGLRISEALGADIAAMGSERGHRTLTVLRKGGKIVTIPLAPRTARSLDLAIGERLDGPIWTPACRCVTSKKRHPMLIREPRCATTAPAPPSTDTPPTSSPPSSPAPPAEPLAPRRTAGAAPNKHAGPVDIEYVARSGRSYRWSAMCGVFERWQGGFSDLPSSARDVVSWAGRSVDLDGAAGEDARCDAWEKQPRQRGSLAEHVAQHRRIAFVGEHPEREGQRRLGHRGNCCVTDGVPFGVGENARGERQHRALLQVQVFPEKFVQVIQFRDQRLLALCTCIGRPLCARDPD